MPSNKLTPAQAKKQKEALAKYHANKDKNTGANIPRVPAKLNIVSKKLSALSGPSIELIGKAINSELVAEKSVWRGSEEDKQKLIEKDSSVRFEIVELEPGIEVEMLIEWVKVPEAKINLAKWIITQDVALKKAAEESKIRKIEAARKEQMAKIEGAIPEEDAQETAKAFGGPRKLDLSGFEDD